MPSEARPFGELSEKEKNAIREDVINKVENGEIDYSETEIKDDIIKGIQKQVNEELDRGGAEHRRCRDSPCKRRKRNHKPSVRRT